MAKITKRNSNNNELRIAKHAADSFDACVERIIDGNASLQDLLNVKKQEIDFAKCLRKIKTIQKIYSAGSKVGACTIVAGNMVTVKLTEESMEAYKKAMKMLEANETHTPYGDSIWVEGYNMFSEFYFTGDRAFRYTYYVVTNEEIDLLEQKIRNMDYNSVTLEDLQALQNDLPPFVRAWQESSIDVSKDKDKVFNKDFADFFKKVNVISTHLKNQAENILFNLDEAKLRHRAGRTKDISFEITLPLDKDVLPDILGDINLGITQAVEEYYNGDLLDLYKNAGRNYYEQFADEALEYPELALYIQQVYALVSQSYNEDTKLTKEQYELLRDAIYTKAAACGMTDMTQVVKVAISVAMRYVKETTDKNGNKYIDLGTANVNNYKPSKVTGIFPAEYVALRGNKKETKELTLLYVDRNTTIEEGQTVEFVAGFSVDDTVEVEELYTGTAYNKGGKLVYDVDPYQYKEVDTVITIATFAEDATPQEQTEDEGEFATEYFKNNETVILTGKNSNVLVAEDKKTLVAKVVTAPELKQNGKARLYSVKDYICFQPNAGRSKVFFIVLSK
jgi:hypothetical protein